MTSNQVVFTMFDIKTSIHMDRFIPHRGWDEDPGLSIHYVIFFSQTVKEIIWAWWYIYCHIDPHCIGMWLCLSSHSSTMYFSWLWSAHVMQVCIHIVALVAISLVNIFHGSVVYWLATVLWVISYFEHRYACLGNGTYINIVWCFFATSFRFSNSTPLHWRIVKCFDHQFLFWPHTLGGNLLHTKIPHLSTSP